MRETDGLGKKYKSTTHYVLMGLLPYTEANIKLSFKPSLFFNDLEKLDKVKNKKESLRNAYYRLIKQGLIEIDNYNTPKITTKGLRKIQPYRSKKLKGSKLLVIFDIPESERKKRDQLRLLLKELLFKQVQKSVWLTDLDYRTYLKAEIKRHDLEKYVVIFEARFI